MICVEGLVLDEYIYKLNNRFLNYKESMKFYIDKNVYDLFDFCVFYKNSFSFEFFTMNNDYERIFEYFRKEFDTRLICMGWDVNYNCYCVDFSCVPLLEWLDHWHCHLWVVSSEIHWKRMVRNKGWVDENEVHEGWLEYKRRRDAWFKRNY